MDAKKIRDLSTEEIIKKIEDNNQKMHRLKAQYPYKQGRPPKEDNKAQKNINNRKNLKRENSEYTQKLSQYNNEKTQILYYKDRINKIFDVKYYKTGINKINKLLNANIKFNRN